MDNQDQLYEQFQQAAKKSEAKDFDAMEKVWARVEEKLEQKELIKENKWWKKIAVAASFLLVLTVGYQVFKDKSEIIIPANPKENIIVNEKIPNITAPSQDNAASPSLIEKKEIEKIIQMKTQDNLTVVSTNDPESRQETAKNSIVYDSISPKEVDEGNSGAFAKRKFESVGVRSSFVSRKDSSDSTADQTISQKQNPLVVINGKAIINKKDDTVGALLKKNNTANQDIEEMTILQEPLYIINGVEYSEAALFGPNPTSPYFPLDKQEIIETTILLEEEGQAVYGEKGKMGVVIIKTKGGQPLKK